MLARFASNHQITFPLLSDKDSVVICKLPQTVRFEIPIEIQPIKE